MNRTLPRVGLVLLAVMVLGLVLSLRPQIIGRRVADPIPAEPELRGEEVASPARTPRAVDFGANSEPRREAVVGPVSAQIPEPVRDRDVAYFRKKSILEALPGLDDPTLRLKSVPLRMVMLNSIAVILDSQGRGIPRTPGVKVQIPKASTGQYTMILGGTTYSFGRDEFPEYKEYMEHRGDAPESYGGLAYVIGLVKQRGQDALAILK